MPARVTRRSVRGAVSQANVELVLSAYEFFARTGRYPLHLIDPDIEMVESDELPGDLSGRGHANLSRLEEVLLDAFDDWRTRWRAPGKSVGIGFWSSSASSPPAKEAVSRWSPAWPIWRQFATGKSFAGRCTGIVRRHSRRRG